MTAKQFNELNVGSSVNLPTNRKKTKFIRTEVVEIDRIFKKIRVVYRSKWTSYKFFPFSVDNSTITAYTGIVR